MFRPGVPTIRGLRIAVLAGPGCDDTQVKSASEALTDAGATVKVLAQTLGHIKAQKGMVKIDHTLATTPSIAFDAAVIPGGESALQLAKDAKGSEFVRDMNEHLKTIIACKKAQPLLDAAGVKTGAPGVLYFPRNASEWKQAIAAIAKHKHQDRET